MCKKRGFELPEFNSPRWLSIENLFGEEWKDVKSLKGLYAISNYGRLKSHKRLWKCGNNTVITKEETIAKTSLRKNRYISYRACIDGKLIHVVIHRLVAENFLDNPLCLPFVNHKDENPSNNCVDNLEWCTAKCNSNYGTCQQRRVKKLKDNMREMWHEIHQYSLDGNLINTYVGKSEIEKAGFSYTMVTRCCLHKVVKSQGYVWRYDNDPFSIREYIVSKTNQTPVVCYDMQMNEIRKYDSVADASLDVHGNKNGGGNIVKCCKGKTKYAYGFKWRFLNDKAKSSKRSVLCYDSKMNLVAKYESLASAAEAVLGDKRRAPNIILCCQNQHRTIGGFFWRYTDEKE